jgi:transposase
MNNKYFFSAHAISKVDPSAVANVFKSESRGSRPRTTVKTLIDIAASSVGIVIPAKEFTLKQEVSLLIHVEEQMKEITKVLMNILNEKMKQDVEILYSMKGIGENTAMNFLIETGGTVEICENYKKLIAASGLGVHY